MRSGPQPTPGTPEARFRCCSCAACCQHLRRGARPGDHREPFPGLYELPTPGGLQVLTFELVPERASGRVRATPKLAVATDSALLVLLWELDHDACPVLDDAARCTAFARRPLVCRAYPLLATRHGVVTSGACHQAVPLPTEPARQDADASVIYPVEWPAARAAPAALLDLWQHVEALVANGQLVPAPGLGPAELAERPAVDLATLLEDLGITTAERLRRHHHGA